MALGKIDRSRQEMDPRFDQGAISGAGIMIVGSGDASTLAAICAASLGFERVVLVRNDSASAAGALDPLLPLDQWIGWRYPDVPVVAMDAGTPQRFARMLTGRIAVAIVEPGYAANLAGFIPEDLAPERLIAMNAFGEGVAVSVGSPDIDLPALASEACLGSSMLAAGLALGEARRIIAPCPDDTIPESPVSFWLPPPGHSLAEVAVAGAGGTGSLFAPAAADQAKGPFRIYDPDEVESTNLARCPFLTAVGNNKARDLAESPLMERITVEPVPEPAGIHWLDDTSPQTVAAFCTDTLASRRVLNRAACEKGVPSVNIGTSLWGAVVNTVTKHSQCLECRFPNLDERIEYEAAQQQTNSCGRRPEASGIVSNMVAAGAAAMIARRLRDNDFVFAGSLAYDAFDPKRLYVTSVRPKCTCFRGRNKEETDVVR